MSPKATDSRKSSIARGATPRGALFSIGVFSFFTNLLMLTGPIFMLQIYDRVLSISSYPTLVVLFALTGMLYLFMGVIESIRSRVMIRVGARFAEELQAPAFDAVTRQAVRNTPGVGTQPIHDVETVRNFLSGPGPFTLFDMPWAPIFIAVNFLLHPVLGYITLAGVLLLFLMAWRNEAATRKAIMSAQSAGTRARALSEEARGAAGVLQAMGMRDAYRDRWIHLHNEAQDLHMRAADLGGTNTAITKALRMFLQSGILAAGAALAIAGEVTAGTMIAASIILSRAVAPMEQAVTHWRGLVAARHAYRRIRSALSARAPTETMALPAPRGRLEVEALTVCAPGTEQILLRNITFNLSAGGGLGIIGPTGAGKSTLGRVLAGVWPPDRGDVRLDGATLDQWMPAQLGPAIGYVPDTHQLLSGTVEQNIARFAQDPEPEAIVKAAKAADVHEMILRLPDGYATDIGECGQSLSSGQRQRLALARALYGDPVLLILDEPNANLDAGGEQALVHAIHAARQRGATVVVIAHRMSAINAVDDLLYLKDGKQVVFGPKKEVLSMVTTSADAATLPPQARQISEG